MKVLKPVGKNNPLTQGYKASHKGYDFDDIPDANAYSSFHGVVTVSKNSETRNWIANKASDPYKNDPRRPALITDDYGNYCKIRGEVDGQTVYQLCAHLEPGTVLPKGTEVKAGQIVGRIGNTGNSTGSHIHVEYRDRNNQNFPVEFVSEQEQDQEQEETMEKLPKDNVIRDFYTAVKSNFSEDEIDRWLQENKNLVQIFTSVMEGDDAVKEKWQREWGLKEPDYDIADALQKYQDRFRELKDVFGMPYDNNTEEVVAAVTKLKHDYEALKKEKTPDTIYKHSGKDFQSWFVFMGILVGIEKKEVSANG